MRKMAIYLKIYSNMGVAACCAIYLNIYMLHIYGHIYIQIYSPSIHASSQEILDAKSKETTLPRIL